MDPFSPFATTGLNPGAGPATAASAPGVQPATANNAGPSAADNANLWHPDHPMFWVGVIIAVTVGLVGVNSSVRVGKFRAAVGAGKS